MLASIVGVAKSSNFVVHHEGMACVKEEHQGSAIISSIRFDLFGDFFFNKACKCGSVSIGNSFDLVRFDAERGDAFSKISCPLPCLGYVTESKTSGTFVPSFLEFRELS